MAPTIRKAGIGSMTPSFSDPYAKALAGLINWGEEMFAYKMAPGNPDADLERDYRDDAWGIPKCVVLNDTFDWGDEKRPNIPLAESVIYEVHVKGFSQLCPHIPEDIRGTYAALGSDFAIAHFKKLGVTAVELLPVQHFVNDQFLLERTPQLLGLQFHRVLCSALGLLGKRLHRGPGHRVQGDGETHCTQRGSK